MLLEVCRFYRYNDNNYCFFILFFYLGRVSYGIFYDYDSFITPYSCLFSSLLHSSTSIASVAWVFFLWLNQKLLSLSHKWLFELATEFLFNVALIIIKFTPVAFYKSVTVYKSVDFYEPFEFYTIRVF
jgi:hypothetical protein